MVEKIFYIFFFFVCGIFVVGGNLVLFVVFNCMLMVGFCVNDYFIGLFVFVDFMIGFIMILLYVCYVLVFVDLWVVKFEFFFWIVIVIVIMYSLIVVSIDRLILVVYFLCYY